MSTHPAAERAARTARPHIDGNPSAPAAQVSPRPRAPNITPYAAGWTCASGWHFWLDQADARLCCNGARRAVATLRAATGGPIIRYYWRALTPYDTAFPWEPGGQHIEPGDAGELLTPAGLSWEFPS